jgi:hypothetical protein
MKNAQLQNDVLAFIYQLVNEISALPDDKHIELQKHNVLQTAASAGSIFEHTSHSLATTTYSYKLNELSRELSKINFWIKYFAREGYIKPELACKLLNDSAIVSDKIKKTQNTEIIELAESYRGEWFLED